MTLRQIAPFAALGVVSLALAGWWLQVDDGPDPIRIAQRTAAPIERPVPSPKPHPVKAKAATARVPEQPLDGELPELLRELEPEERKELRDLVREEQWAETETRLYGYAEKVGWDPALTDEVRTILEETTNGVSKRLRKVDAGKATWEELKPELREFRMEQAEQLRETLGDDGFLKFAEGMDFWRYNGGARPGRPMGRHLAGQPE